MSTIDRSVATRTVMKISTVCVSSWFVLLSAGGAAADVVTDWNARAGKAAIAACIAPADDPLHESRMYTMMHVAIHDALNAIDRRSRPYAYNARAGSSVSADAAVAAAARDVLVATIGELPFPPRVSRPESPAPRLTMQPRSPSYQTAPRGHKASRWDRLRPRQLLRCGSMTGPTPRCRTSVTRRVSIPVSIDSRLAATSRLRPAGAASRLLC